MIRFCQLFTNHFYETFLQSSEGIVTLRTRKFMTNRLLQRRQMVVDVLHPNKVRWLQTITSRLFISYYSFLKCTKINIAISHFLYNLNLDFRLPYQRPKYVRSSLKCTNAQLIVYSHLVSKQTLVVVNL